MTAIDTNNLTISQAHAHLRAGDFSVKELAQAYLDAIQAKDGDVHAYLEVYEDVLQQAEAAQKFYDMESCSPLAGIPLAVKDNILIKGRVASSASKILENYVASYDATVIKHLKQAGAVFLGRTNMDEFAMGGSTENSAFGSTKNPHDLTKVPGGSSGGSAAAVAMGGALAALGSDTGGSIRQPSSFCGLVGLKTTYGATSRFGVMAMTSSFDQIGPIARSIDDAEIIFRTISQPDPNEATSVGKDTIAKQQRKLEKKVIGVPVDFIYTDGVSQDVQDNFKASMKLLEEQGYTIREISLPNFKYALPTYYILVYAESSSNLARFDGIRYGERVPGRDLIATYEKSRGQGFGEEVRRRIMLGTYVLSAGYYDAYYNQAKKVQSLIAQDIRNTFDDVDFIATPTSPTTAIGLGEKSDPLSMYLIDIFTVTANVVGVPAISVPSGQDANELPYGIQFMAPHFNEDHLFTIGRDFESAQE